MGTVLELRHKAEDGDAWLEHFVAREGPERQWDVRRSSRDPDELVLTLRFTSREAAEAVLASSDLRQALRSAGAGETSVRAELRDDDGQRGAQ